MDTMLLMGLKLEFERALVHVSTMKFDLAEVRLLWLMDPAGCEAQRRCISSLGRVCALLRNHNSLSWRPPVRSCVVERAAPSPEG
jgi:hypothetical protein